MAENRSGGRLAAWDAELEALYNELSGRGSFRYDAAADPLYMSYADQGVQSGRLAMRDTMGQAAALTGGYGSSYAQSVGQQQYDEYLRRLGEAMPQFYSMARQSWEAEGDALRDRYELLNRRAGDERDRLAAEAAAEAAAKAEEEKRRQAADKEAWQRQQTAYKSLVALIQNSGYEPTDAELKAAGLSAGAAKALREAWLSKQKPTRRGRSRGTKTGETESRTTQSAGVPVLAPLVSSVGGILPGRVQLTR